MSSIFLRDYVYVCVRNDVKFMLNEYYHLSDVTNNISRTCNFHVHNEISHDMHE